MIPALSAWTSSPAPGTSVTIETSAVRTMSTLVLADADGLDQDDVLARRVEHQRRVAGGTRQPAQVTARRHAADEDAGVTGMRLHPDAVAEDVRRR